MRSIDDTFFRNKRTWSLIKDSVLGSYLPPYLSKVKKLKEPILIVDCFAGPGTFDDGKPGSPLIICEQIQKFAPHNAKAYFVNKLEGHHQSLQERLKPFISSRIANAFHRPSAQFLDEITGKLTRQTLFVYLDPFGITGCNFAAIRRLLERNRLASTEVLMTLSMPPLHRLAAHRATGVPGSTGLIPRFHAILDSVFGRTPWREIMFDTDLSASEKEAHVVAAYCQQLRKYIKYVCSCPVRESDDGRVKYYIIFASRHPDALVLMNDIMLTAYEEQMFPQAVADAPLFNPIYPDWRTARNSQHEALALQITTILREEGPLTRENVWLRVVANAFMKYREAEFKEAIKTLVAHGEVLATPISPRLNNKTLLRLPQKTF